MKRNFNFHGEPESNKKVRKALDENDGGVLREAHRALNRAIESLEAIKREMAMNKEGYQRVDETITSIQDLIPHIIHNIGKNKAGDNWDEDDYEDTEVDHY